MKNFKYSNLLGKLPRDLSCYTCGIEECKPGHSYGPTIRSGYMFYFILDGEGIYQFHNDKYNVNTGEGFLIIPNNLIRFEASLDNPWTYLWIGLTGNQISNYLQNTCISEKNPIFKFSMYDKLYKCAEEIIKNHEYSPQNNLKVTSRLYIFLETVCELYPCMKKNNIYNDSCDIIESAIYIINNNYCDSQLTINSIADSLHINRSYLYRIFKAKLGQSPQQYLINYRINRAKDLIENKNLQFNIIAGSVGYKDTLTFSREFKRRTGVSPSEYRELFHTDIMK
ncbi:MAG: AraC family transcriptional regulator [Clostridium sp.]